MKNTSSAIVILSVLWPLLSWPLLYALEVAWLIAAFDGTTGNLLYNNNLFIEALRVIGGHVIVFCIMPLIIFSKIRNAQVTNEGAVMAVLISGAIAGVMQLIARFTSSVIGHFSCGDSCVGEVSVFEDNLLTVLTGFILVILWTYYWLRLKSLSTKKLEY